ncbi:MAG: hypothetical protein ACLP1X_01265 [Polyangiaceae bacterium]
MMKLWRWVGLAGASAAISLALEAGCGGSQSSGVGSPDSAAGDSTVVAADAPTQTNETGVGDAMQEAAVDAGPSCAPPVNPDQAALCVTLTPEMITFLADPAFDGKGLLVVQVFSRAHPDDDAGDASIAGPLVFPSLDGGTSDGGLAQIDLSQPLPQVRIDGLPATTVYARAFFVDDPSTIASGQIQAGWWLGGLDLTGGLDKAPLKPVVLTAGTGTVDVIGLVALRRLTTAVSLAPGVVPAGNGQGPITTVVVDTATPGADSGANLFGSGSLKCGNVSDSGPGDASVVGFVLGKGPYWLAASLDDFGVGTSFPPGALISLVLNDAGALAIPPADMLTYPAEAYQVTSSIAFTAALPWDGGPDPVSCP